MSTDAGFEKLMQDQFGYTPEQTRVYLKISQMQPDLQDALSGSEVAKDIDALLVLGRLSPSQQVALAAVIEIGLTPSLAVALMASGQLPSMLDEVMK